MIKLQKMTDLSLKLLTYTDTCTFDLFYHCLSGDSLYRTEKGRM